MTIKSLGFILALTSLAVPAAAGAQVTGNGGDDAAEGRSSFLLPGDVIDIQIWREEDLSGQFTVDESGVVVLPMIGARHVTGVSARELREDLTREYSVYVRTSSVNVRLLRRITVTGEVRVPGLYVVDATVSIADLIARAGGVTTDANPGKITLVRSGEMFELDLNGMAVVGEAGVRSGDRISVGKRSWISRNLSSLVGVVSIISNVVLIATR